MNSVIKEIGYSCLHLITFGRGITKKINGVAVKFPTRYFRYFPENYEADNFSFINRVVKQGDVVIDIGAHIGLMAVFLGKRVGQSGKVFSFEPTPRTFGILINTIRLNKLQNTIVPVNKAVSSFSGNIGFSANKEDVSNSIVSYEHNTGHGRIEVPTITVDDFVRENNLPRLDLMKIDAEGVELDVLKGASQTLRNFKCKMILALHPAAIAAKGDSLAEIYDLVTGTGYNVYWKNKEITKSLFCEQKDVFDVYLEN